MSIVLLVEVLLAISTSTRIQSAPGWPHTGVLLLLSVANLVLVLAAFFSMPYGSTPATYVTVAPGVGAYVGLVAALLACAGAVTGVIKNSPAASR